MKIPWDSSRDKTLCDLTSSRCIGTPSRRHNRMADRTVTVNDNMQRGYRYALTAPAGRGFDPAFKPELTPAEMLALGIFAGRYMTDCRKEFPKSWFLRAKLSPEGRDKSLNC